MDVIREIVLQARKVGYMRRNSRGCQPSWSKWDRMRSRAHRCHRRALLDVIAEVKVEKMMTFSPWNNS